jgi:hypothetical protein
MEKEVTNDITENEGRTRKIKTNEREDLFADELKKNWKY